MNLFARYDAMVNRCNEAYVGLYEDYSVPCILLLLKCKMFLRSEYVGSMILFYFSLAIIGLDLK